MTLYCIYKKPDKGPEALSILPERFSWAAFLFAPLWALGHGALAYLALWLVVVLGLNIAAPAIGPGTALGLYLVFALWTGFAAANIAARALERRDWIASGEIIASDAATAERIWLEKTYGARP